MRSQRKDEHLTLALEQKIENNDFDYLRFRHQSFPEINYDDVSLKSSYFNRQFNYPLYINAMTGGSAKTKEINRRLAILAKEFDLMMVVGSQHAGLDDERLVESYSIIKSIYPEGFFVANVSPNASVLEAQAAIDMIGASALSIHVNPAQEISMDEGDRDFSNWLDQIQAIVEAVDVPVLVKEVGFGMSESTISQLIQRGVKHIDVSGKGGTNFIKIENARSQDQRFDYLQAWGYSTVESLRNAKTFFDQAEILASGGIRNPLDVLKSLSLGASAVGLSSYFLRLVQLDQAEAHKQFSLFLHDLKLIMLLLGTRNIRELRELELINEKRNYELFR